MLPTELFVVRFWIKDGEGKRNKPLPYVLSSGCAVSAKCSLNSYIGEKTTTPTNKQNQTTNTDPPHKNNKPKPCYAVAFPALQE